MNLGLVNKRVMKKLFLFLLLLLSVSSFIVYGQLTGPSSITKVFTKNVIYANPSTVVGGGNPSFVAFITNNSAALTTATTSTLTNDMSAGDTLVVAVYWESAAATISITNTSVDTFNSYTNVSVAGALFCEMWVAKNCAAGTGVITTVNLGTSHNTVITVAWRISGASTTAPVDQRAVGSDGGSAGGGITETVTTTQAIEVLCYIGANFSSASSTPQASWTEDRDSNGVEFQHFTTSVSGNYFGTNDWAITDAMIAAMLTIK